MMEMVEKAILQTAAAATRLISPLEHITQLHTWIPPGFHLKQYLETCSFPFNLRRMKIYSFKTVFG